MSATIKFDVHDDIGELIVGQLYSNDEIFKMLAVSNAGGIRPLLRDKSVRRIVVMTSIQDSRLTSENPYQDRLEDGVLTYTAAGKSGQQTLAGTNSRVIGQRQHGFPIHGFVQVASRRDKVVGPRRWQYLGLLQYLRHYPDTQIDSRGKVRQVWLFEFKIHVEPRVISIPLDMVISNQILLSSGRPLQGVDDDEVVIEGDLQRTTNFERIEHVRGMLLAMEAREFEFFIKSLLQHCGFTEVCVTKFSADGGVDVNARPGARMWLFANTLIQVQAKRWLHSVGRKEVAELRGSLQPFAKGAVVTTGHFSRAAINEAGEDGKNPIALIDGFTLSRIVVDEAFHLPQ